MITDFNEYRKKYFRVKELKQQLSALDYQTLKHVDGQMTDEEYEPIKQQKIAYRAEINELEAQMRELVVPDDETEEETVQETTEEAPAEETVEAE